MKKTKFMKQLATYFETFLPLNRQCSQNTISSYADGFILFFEYFEVKQGKAHYLIDYKDLTPEVFDEYILWMQCEKRYSPASQKQRISALTSFLKYASRREIAAIPALNSISESRTPKIPKVHFPYFTGEEMKLLLHIPQCNRKSGSRDMVLLSLLYDSGARAQEMCDLCVGDITFGKTSKIRLYGKGNKTREVPVSSDVVELLRYYLRENDIALTKERNRPLFSSQRNSKMTTACIRNLVKKYVTLAKAQNPSLFLMGQYSPHSFRHSKAVHMVEAGIPLIYIRDFLGHESVKTTEIYAKISQATVSKILSNRDIPRSEVTIPGSTSDKAYNIPHFLAEARK